MTKIHWYSNLYGHYLFLVLPVFTFVTYPGSNEAAEDPVVWYFNGLPIFFAAGLTLVYFAIVFLKNVSFKLDIIESWLFARIFICAVPLLYLEQLSSFSAHYPIVIISFLAYYIGRSSPWQFEHQTGLLIVLFGIVLCFQVIETFQLIPIPYFHLDYKRYMRIPIAASNVIAAYIVPIFYLVIFNYSKNRIINLLLIVLFLFAIILTKSRGGVSVLILTFITYLIFFKFKFKLSYIILLLLLIFLIVSYLLEIPEVKFFMMGFSAEKNTIDANSLSSNRLDIYYEEFHRFLSHPIFGNGMVFNSQTSHTGSHNFFIELLVQSGIVGMLTYIIPICIVLKHAIKYKSTPHVMGWILFLIATLFHGLIEVNFFNYSTDIIFWSVCGMLMNSQNNCNVIKRCSTLARSV